MLIKTGLLSSPAITVVKPDKMYHGLDACKMNNVTTNDTYPHPRSGCIFNCPRRTKFITSLDLKNAFRQILLDEADFRGTTLLIADHTVYDGNVGCTHTFVGPRRSEVIDQTIALRSCYS